MEQGLVQNDSGPDCYLQSLNSKVCPKKNLLKWSRALSETIQDQIVKFSVPFLKYVPKGSCSKWSRVWSETIQDKIVLKLQSPNSKVWAEKNLTWMEQGLVWTDLGPDFLLQSPNSKVCTKQYLSQIEQGLV